MKKREGGPVEAAVLPAAKKTKINDIRSLRGMDIEKVVGSGTFGVVFKATIKETGERVALKKFKLEIDTQGQGFPTQALREIKILKQVKRLDNENVVKLFTMVTYVPEDDDEEEGPSRQTTHAFVAGDVFMVFEYVDYDLSGLLKCKDVNLTENHIRSYTKQLLEGMYFLHHNKILHRDIKGPNILVTRENVIKIADLGLARTWRTPDQKFTNSNSVVTLWYRSPELLLGTKNYGFEVDIWSVGCLYGEMRRRDAILKGTSEAEQLDLTYRLMGTPTGELAEYFDKLPYGRTLEASTEKKSQDTDLKKPKTIYPDNFRKKFASFDDRSFSLFESLLQIDPRKRSSAAAALDHDYFWQPEQPMKAEELPRFNVDVATDMSETERIRGERAAKVAAEERLREVKERETGGGGSITGSMGAPGGPG
eukprot:CAMPEP_0119035004 /NCGR_PEP_ID=MMETSP1177-20130426/1994_1 /TAXON_ID=2985 /ORGANISM="Ochromonas sp, Strain CCMP1899" /LENGTH=422 /DNA_ID=CAMNT_0006992861 /DNA_START=133 /DNA_END=1397 /DNA_ORIENTATION=+